MSSLTAAAAGRIGEAVFGIFLYRAHIARIVKSERGDFALVYIRSAALTMLAIGPSLGIMIFFNWSPAAPLAAIIPAVVMGVALWLLGLIILRHPLIDEARKLLDRGPATV